MTPSSTSEAPAWALRIDQLLPLYGHRNWIVVVDSAYPSQSRVGIETILTHSTQEAVVEHTLGRIQKTPHIRPLIHVDAELDFVHDHAAQTFSILILKTTMTIPYTSVFFQLDCAYWDAASETRLRAAMST